LKIWKINGLLFFFLDKKETKNQGQPIPAARATRHRAWPGLTRGSVILIYLQL